MKISAIQLNATNNKKENLEIAEQLIVKTYHDDKPDLIALPEMFHFMGTLHDKKEIAEKINESSETVSLLKRLSRTLKVAIHGGSICEFDQSNYYNTSLVFDSDGKLIAKYRKINLFSFKSTSQLQYDEKKLFQPGTQIISYTLNNIKIGCAICFDLRFPLLFQELATHNVKIIIVPSVFTYETGQAHWEVLCRARAIETQSFLVAPAQTGSYDDSGIKKISWGHSMIVDPWGTILGQLSEEIGYISAELDLDYLKNVRERLPLRALNYL